MAQEQVTDPIPAPEAFRLTGSAAAQSQAAVLLAIGMQLQGDPAFPEEDLARFPLPSLPPAARRFPATPVPRAFPRGLAVREPGAPYDPGDEARARLAERLYRESSPEAAAALLQASLSSPDELVRVSAASSSLELGADPEPLERILVRGTRSTDALTRDVAATALGRVAPGHPALRPFLRRGPTDTDRPPSRTALVVHGTFARNWTWWQPGGGFHEYVRGWRPDLYGAEDRFEWSGGYSDQAREAGGSHLCRWVEERGLEGLDLFAHSHGGSVSMRATSAGMEVGTLALLACPVHPHKYAPDFGRVRNKVVSVRVRMDLVILADRGGQRFRDPRIREEVLPVWFDHSAPRDPVVWDRYDVRSLLP